MTTSSPSLAREPQGTALQELPNALRHDASQNVPAKPLGLHILHILSLMPTKMDMTLKAV